MSCAVLKGEDRRYGFCGRLFRLVVGAQRMAAFCLFGTQCPVLAQWVPGANGSISYSGGSVGIGTPSPALNGGASTPHTLITQIKGALVVGGTTQNGNDDGLLQFGSFTFAGSNNWSGYGVFGSNLAVKSVGSTDTFYTPLSHPWLGYSAMVTGSSGIQFIAGNGTTTGGGAVSPAARMFISSSSGAVGIGTAAPCTTNAPSGCIMSVNGAIQAKEIVVNTGWPDYVFDADYALRPLKDVAGYIRENHHLPDIPSQAEVKENGVSLGDMQGKLLAKIEELTLHMIRAEDRNDRLEQENAALRLRIRQIEERLPQ